MTESQTDGSLIDHLTFDSQAETSYQAVTTFSDGVLTREMQLGEIHATTQMEVGDLHKSEQNDLDGCWWLGRIRGKEIRLLSGSHKGELVRSVDLFCGSGGFSLGVSAAAEELGLKMKSMAAVDIDEHALEVFRANHAARIIRNCSVTDLVDYSVQKDAENYSFFNTPEIVDEQFEKLVGRVELVLGGPPCQGHSNLNNHTRRNDPRNSLYALVVVMAQALGAKVALTENVQGVLRDHGDVVNLTKGLIETSGWSYDEAVLAADSLGWAQTRKRHFLCAWRDAKSDSGTSFNDVSEMLSHRSRPVSWLLSDLLEQPNTDEMFNKPSDLSDENKARVAQLFEADEYTLRDQYRPVSHQNGNTYPSSYGRLHWDQPSGTITTGFLTPGRGRFIHPTQPRGLTPHEGARLQGYPDVFRFSIESGKVTRSLLAKWIGDAVPMPLGYAAGMVALSRVVSG